MERPLSRPGRDSEMRTPRMRVQTQCLIVSDIRHVRAEFIQNAYRACILMKNVHNNNQMGILDILQTETVLVTKENLVPLPSRSQSKQIRADSRLGRIWDHYTGMPLLSVRMPTHALRF